jgi:predicted ribosome quality control (RQC) complex YloA/Tae2 family protein
MAPPFDSLTLRAVAAELGPALVGGQVQKIRQPDEFTVILNVYAGRATRRLLVCAHPERFRAHLTTQEFTFPKVAPTFCMALRKYLEGGRVLSVAQDGVDRVLRLVAATSWGEITLVAELMGRHSNIVLLSEDGTILEAIKPVGSKLSRRVVLPGRPYPPLPAPAKPPLFGSGAADSGDTPADGEVKQWLEGYSGVSPFLAEYVAATDDPPTAVRQIVQDASRGTFLPAVYRNADGIPTGAWPFPPPGTDPDASRDPLSMSEALDIAYATRAEAAKRGALLHALNAILDKEEHSLQRRRQDLEAVERNAERAEEWRIAGELLAANAHGVEKGAVTVSLPNYYAPDMAPMEIALDPVLSPRENADAYFAKQHKARGAAARVPAQRAELDARAAVLAARRAEIAAADEPTLERLLAEWSSPAPNSPSSLNAGGGGGKPGGSGKSDFPPGVRIRRFTSDEGWPIWVGDNATGNDYLTTRASDPDDIWLHVRAAASAHGVIKTGKRPEAVPPATLRRAAEIVASRSEAKASGSIPVDYTLRRYVRKPRNSAPGRVTYEREKTIYVGPDTER